MPSLKSLKIYCLIFRSCSSHIKPIPFFFFPFSAFVFTFTRISFLHPFLDLSFVILFQNLFQVTKRLFIGVLIKSLKFTTWATDITGLFLLAFWKLASQQLKEQPGKPWKKPVLKWKCFRHLLN